LEGIVSSGWHDLIVIPDKQGRLRVDRLKYELCVLQVLRERLRCPWRCATGLSSLDAQPEPVNLSELKSEILKRWPMTSLLDMLKETDLRTDFSKAFKSATGRESLDPATFAEESFTLLVRAGHEHRTEARKQRHWGRKLLRFGLCAPTFHPQRALPRSDCECCQCGVSGSPAHIWGEATTACASDSKKFGAWDQNLMTEWHVRYGGKGIMIYWHVERHAVCIYSQLKTCSSSEVAAMIEGLLRHATEMEVDKNYVDSHGQSEVAFAFCRLLGLQLLPRFKAIHGQKLYRSEAGRPEAYPNLQAVLTRPIDWQLIQQQYDQMIKYAIALRLGAAEKEAILKRFTLTWLLQSWARRSKRSFFVGTYTPKRCGAKSKKASTSSRPGTGPTALSCTAKAVRSPLTTWRTRSSLCWRFTCCRSALSTSIP
jgi:hypothetical protein